MKLVILLYAAQILLRVDQILADISAATHEGFGFPWSLRYLLWIHTQTHTCYLRESASVHPANMGAGISYLRYLFIHWLELSNTVTGDG